MRPRKSKPWLLLVGCVFGTLLSFSKSPLLISFENSKEEKTEDYLKEGETAFSLEGGGFDALSIEKNEDLSALLLIDSILSITHSYYVDLDRINHRELFDYTIESLRDNYNLKIDKKDEKVAISLGKLNQEFALTSKNLSYHQFLEYLYKLSVFIDNFEGSSSAKTDGGGSVEKRGSMIVLNNLLASLDAHSSLLSADAYKELKQGTEGSFGGLGVLVGVRDQLLTVIKPLPHSPAERFGIHRYDRILSIDGIETFGSSLDQLVDHMRGAPGTSVSLSLLRAGDQASQAVSLRREIILVDSVDSKPVKGDATEFLQMKIDNFSMRTSQELQIGMDDFRKKHQGKLPGVILDLRGNPGGLLDQAIRVADLFLSDGTIVSTRGQKEEIEKATFGLHKDDFPLVVIVDEESASASEIVAGALQDQKRALIIGQPSFGKGSVQTIFELPQDRALKLTIARYYTPSGRSIQNVGITPDIWMQPVLSSEKNYNLLGNYRYKNERFLSHHLMVNNSEGQDKLNPRYKGYYLCDKIINESNRDDTTGNKDIEGDLAVKILDAFYQKNLNKPVGKEQVQVKNFLETTSQVIQNTLVDNNQKLVDSLGKRFAVNWQPMQQDKILPKLTLSIGTVDKTKVKPGDIIKIPVNVQNGEKVPFGRLSIFVRSQRSAFETTEKLLGSIEAGATKNDTIEITIPSYWEPGRLKLETGLAMEGLPTAIPMQEVFLEVEDRVTPNLKAQVVELKEDHGTAHPPGKLEATESATVKVDILNDSEIEAHDLMIHVFNLAGEQISVKQEDQKIQLLKPRAHETVWIHLQGSKSIVSPDLELGLAIESKDLQMTYKKTLHIVGTVSR